MESRGLRKGAPCTKSVCRETEAARVQLWGNGFSIPLSQTGGVAGWHSDEQLLTLDPWE